MSAYVVDRTHIDVLVTAGLSQGTYGPLRWLWPELSAEDERDAFQAGEPWGPRAIELAQERSHQLTPQTANYVGQMLWAENVRSVNHRYEEDEWEQVYEHQPIPGKVDPLIVLKAIACYQYQSCEHPGWAKSEAHAYTQALQDAMIRALPGYEDAPGWDIGNRDVFTKHTPATS